MAVYLHLFHGRAHPNQDMEDWGTDGPTIGPLKNVHMTYMSTFAFGATRWTMQRYFPEEVVRADTWSAQHNQTARTEFDHELTIEGDLILFQGVYYGDWSVTDRRGS